MDKQDEHGYPSVSSFSLFTGRVLAAVFCLLLLSGCAGLAPTNLPQFQPDITTTPTFTISSPSATPPALTAITPPALATVTRTPLPPSPTPVIQLGPFRLVSGAEPLLPGLLNDIFLPQDGSLWLSSDRGVARIFAAEQRVYLTRFWDQVVGADDAGQIWVVSQSGAQISSWDGYQWTHYGPEEGWLPLAYHPLRDRVQPGLSIDSQGRIWLLTAWDVRRFDGRQWIVSTPSTTGLPLPWRQGVATTLAFTLVPGTAEAWLGGCDWQDGRPIGSGGLRHFNGRYWEDSEMPAANICISALNANAQGSVWAGGLGEVWSRTTGNGVWQQYLLPEPEQTRMTWGVVLDLPVSPAGTVWPRLALCGEAGCDLWAQRYQWDSGVWQAQGKITPVQPEKVLFDQAGTTWLFTPQSIFNLGTNPPTCVAQLEVIAPAVGPDGRLWLVGGSGNGSGNSIWATP